MILSLLLAALTMAQDGCIARSADYSQETHPQPLQASGKGLWIGGHAFGPSDIATAAASTDPYGIPVIQIRLSAEGRRKFREAQRCGVGHMLEISIDGAVISRPILQEPITGDAMTIAGGWNSQAEVEAAVARILPRPR